MFKKPAPPGKENVVAPRPRLGLSSLQHSAKMKVENDIESAGASLKVLSVENSRQKVTSLTSAANKGAIVSHSSQSTVRSSQMPKSTATNGVSRTDQQAKANPKSAAPMKNTHNGIASNGDKSKMTNEVKSKPQAPNTVEHEPKAETNRENAVAKTADDTGAQQNGENPTTIKKTGSWELSNFDIGRPLGRGKHIISGIFIFHSSTFILNPFLFWTLFH